MLVKDLVKRLKELPQNIEISVGYPTKSVLSVGTVLHLFKKGKPLTAIIYYDFTNNGKWNKD